LNSTRVDCIERAFGVIDGSRNGQLELEELKARFDATRHPSVLNGDTTAQLVTNEFFETFEAHRKMFHGDDKVYWPVSLEQFGDYFSSVSSLYEADEDFVQMMTATWGMKTASAYPRREANPPAVNTGAKRW